MRKLQILNDLVENLQFERILGSASEENWRGQKVVKIGILL